MRTYRVVRYNRHTCHSTDSGETFVNRNKARDYAWEENQKETEEGYTWRVVEEGQDNRANGQGRCKSR